jgi:mRNA-degrading endonuclease RelE of RelBE toxin-antitoxin system
MAYEVLLQPRARKEFLALPPDIARKITKIAFGCPARQGEEKKGDFS